MRHHDHDLRPGDTATQTFLAEDHLATADLAAFEAQAIEAAGSTDTWQDAASRHFGAATSAVFHSVAFLEGTINELFAEIASGEWYRVGGFDQRTFRLYSGLWNLGVPRTSRFSILDKYEIALLLADKTPMKRDKAPTQDVALLVRLRNALMHYEPEWVVLRHDTEDGFDEHRLTRALCRKFPANPHAPKDDPFYPQRCIGAGCAHWAVRSVVAFADQFFEHLERLPTYDSVRERLQTLTLPPLRLPHIGDGG